MTERLRVREIDWTAPDEEVFRFVTDEIREVGVHLLGRGLYETMLYWETADQDPSLDDSMLEWADLLSSCNSRNMDGSQWAARTAACSCLATTAARLLSVCSLPLSVRQARKADLRSAFRSRKFEMPDRGHEGGRMYIGRSGTARYRSVLTSTAAIRQRQLLGR